ncbi:hypothetical protein [Turicibacter bilis]|uniref:Uncharacterized protein n=1 Tax=Turicibacter bilis TaxID=2735723 RepID=A0ABY5JGH6_9FIRM|nr:hypothetical protein [Turicibacter bilis]MBS3201475.1 hypothetical protein [Turicibacter bilis]UUF05685.1 hypothetical protein J0J69_11595 [Turicibacter bilis]
MKQTRRARMVNETNVNVSKDYYSIGKLTSDITGLSEDNLSHSSESKNIRKMINIVGLFLNNSKEDLGIIKNKLQIPVEEYPKYLDFYSRLYNSEIEGQTVSKLMEKSNLGEEIGDIEMMKIGIIFQELIKKEFKNDPIYPIIDRWMEDRFKNTYLDEANRVWNDLSSLIEKNIENISQIYSSERRLQALKSYKKAIVKISDIFMKNIEKELKESQIARDFDDMLLFPKEKRSIDEIEEMRKRVLELVAPGDEQSAESIHKFFNNLINNQ